MLNEESRTSVEAVGASFDGEFPKPIDPAVLRSAMRVILVGAEAQLDDAPPTIEVWQIEEPSLNGIGGAERMNLIRDELLGRVDVLAADLGLLD